MAVQNSPHLEMWDPFFRLVQESLVEPLGLENVEISVPRHQGTNGLVGLRLPPHKGQKTESLDHGENLSRKQLTLNQLTVEIQSILDELLQDCRVDFGSVEFFVDKGVLRKTVFAFANRPEESSQSYFTKL